MEDRELFKAFEQQRVTREEWTHEAHVRVAWLYARAEPTLEQALDKIRKGIRRINRALGSDPKLYHETVTIAFMTLIYARVTLDDAPDTWSAFKGLYPDLFDANEPILHRYYTKGTLTSDAARTAFVPPDLEAFPLQAG